MFNASATDTVITRIEACVAEIKTWMITYKLVLNGDKTVIIVLTALRHSFSCAMHHINIDSHDIVLATSHKSGGYFFRDELSLDSHIKHMCNTLLFHLKNISNN